MILVLLKYAPPNKAIAPIGVKLGMCGIILVIEAKNYKDNNRKVC